MKENFQWDDTDGNNGYWYDDFRPAELQAVWELQGMPFWAAFRAVPGMAKLKLWLNYYGQPQTDQIPIEKDAISIKTAIEARAAFIEASGNIDPPTIEKIRESILALINGQ